jgi:hypothetical protein
MIAMAIIPLFIFLNIEIIKVNLSFVKLIVLELINLKIFKPAYLYLFSSAFFLLTNQMNGQTCKTYNYIYLNDTQDYINGFVHKFRINDDGSFTEIPNGISGTTPWFPSGAGLPSPHGIGQDLNGNVYIGQSGEAGPIAKLTCDGKMINASFVNDAGYNFASKDGILYIPSSSDNTIKAYTLCDGSLLGYITLNGVPANPTANGDFVYDWGFSLGPDGNFYVSSTFGPYNVLTSVSNIYRFTTTLTDFANHTIYQPFITNNVTSGATINHSLFPASISNQYDVYGITSDPSGNMYVVVNDYGTGYAGPNTTWILKFNKLGALVASTFEAITNDGVGFEGSRGIIYFNGNLYLSGAGGDCIAKVDATTLTYTGASVGHVNGQVPKGIGIVQESCQAAGNTVIDSTICSSSIGQKLFLQNLISKCEAPVCGTWTAASTNSGVIYNDCDNSITLNSLNACGSFTLSGGGGNSPCPAFSLTLNLKFGSVTGLSISSDQIICSNIDLIPLVASGASASTPISYQWQKSTIDCKNGFTNISGATNSTYLPVASSTKTYFRAIASALNNCNTQQCSDTSNCVTINVMTSPSSDITFLEAECINGAISLNASFTIANQQNVAKYDYISGITYTGTKSYTSLPNITPANSIISLPNPTVTKSYTIRLYNQGGTCFTDKTVEIKHIDCPLVCPPVTCLPIDSIKN